MYAYKLGHPIADAHPGNIDDIVFPGQDYNNARIYDFEDIEKWENNKRTVILQFPSLPHFFHPLCFAPSSTLDVTNKSSGPH
jgi:hypothetical protein